MNKRYVIILALVCLVLFSMQVAFAAEAPGKLPNVKILATGGTIAGSGATSATTVGYTAAVFPVDALINGVPELKNVANVTGEQISQIASENMTNKVWLKLGQRINELLASDDVDGIVVTHGTDTLEETAYFLNLVVKSNKPVVVVGAMRPSTAMSADGYINLYNSVILAGSKEARGKGVMVCMNDAINGAREVTKTNTALLDTFRAPELGYMGYMQDSKPHFYRESTRRHTTNSEFDITGLTELPKVDIVYEYANVPRLAVDAFVNAGDKGLIIAGVGDGSLATPVKDALIEAQKKGVAVLRSSRTGNGIVARNGEANDDQLHFAASDTLNPQKSRILLMLALTKTSNVNEIQRMFWEY
jgi:L-asparaginase